MPSTLIGVEQEVAMIPCWSVKQSVTLREAFL